MSKECFVANIESQQDELLVEFEQKINQITQDTTQKLDDSSVDLDEQLDKIWWTYEERLFANDMYYKVRSWRDPIEKLIRSII